MADKEQLAVLRQCVEAWNAWRKQNPGVKPDLQNADLVRVHLTEADLTEADLFHADLYFAELNGTDFKGASLGMADLACAKLGRANLSNADVTWTDLRYADLDGADLSHADLTNADLRWAFLCNANFVSADLSRANLTGADFTGADLTDVKLDETVFGAVDLSEVKGLQTCVHHGPSVVDHATLQRSGQLPLSFLRGAGLPDNLIEYLPLLLHQPIQFYSCFISYSSKDDEFVTRLNADLQDKGIRCWFAPEDMKIGERTRTRIDEVIRIHERLLLVLSANSIKSDWVEKEVETAFEKERQTKTTVLLPVRLDDAVMESETGWAADIRRTRDIGDFRHWKDHDGYRKAFERLSRDLKIELTAR